MFWQKLRKVGNSYVVTIPKEEVERQKLQDGQLLSIEIRPAEIRPVISPDLRKAFEDSWQQNEKTYHYLAEN